MSGQIIYFQHELDQKIEFQVYQGQTINFYSQQNFEKAKKKKKKTNNKNKKTDTTPPRERGGGEVRMLVQKGARTRTGFSMGFFFILHTARFCMCICIYIIVSKRIVIEGGIGVLPQNYFK